MLESFAVFYEQLKTELAIFAAVYSLCPLALLLWRWLQGRGQCYLPVNCHRVLRHRRILLWIQQCGFTLAAAVLLQDHIRVAGWKSLEPDAVIAGVLLIAVLFDQSLQADAKYLRLSWLPIHGACMLYLMAKALAHTSVVHACSAVVLICSGLVACVHVVVNIDIPQKLEPPEEYTCNVITYCVFSFVTRPILLLALRKGFLSIEDVPGLVDHDSCRDVYEHVAAASAQTTLLRRLLAPIWFDIIRSGAFQFMSSVLNFATPLALGRIVTYVSSLGGSESGQPEQQRADSDRFGGVTMTVHAAVLVLFVAPVAQAVVFGQMLSAGRHIGIRIKAAVISVIFKKALSVDLTATNDGIGKLNNMISVDAQSIQNFMCYCHQIWSAFLEIVIAVTLLYMVLGKAAFAGVVAMLLSVPSCFYLTKRMARFQDELLERKDARMSAVGELLGSIRIIKLFAWECRFEEQARALRSSELQSLRGYMFSRAGMGVLWEAIPTTVALITFLFRSYYLEEPLSAAQGYAGLMMFSLLKHPLAAFPEMSGWCINALVALRRIAGFLAVEDILGSRAGRLCGPGSGPASGPGPAVELSHASFGWNAVRRGIDGGPSQGQGSSQGKGRGSRSGGPGRLWRRAADGAAALLRPGDVRYAELEMTALDEEDQDQEADGAGLRLVLRDVHAAVERGSLFAVIGPTGCGKSTLLAGLFGECKSDSEASVRVRGSVSYAPQVPWIQQATVRENILFGAPLDRRRYDEVVRCCALQSDLDMLPLGDLTEIGEKGVNLSGGQKQRVSLARAAYSRSDTVVMDDVLSAVDAHVGEHIFRELICGLLRGRTRILVTHQLSLVLPKADMVLCLRGAGPSAVPASTGSGSGPAPGAPASSVLALCHPSRLGDALRACSGDLNLPEGSGDDGFVSILQSLVLCGTPAARSRQGSLDGLGAAAFAVPDRPPLQRDLSAAADVPLDDYEARPPPDVASGRWRAASGEGEGALLAASCSYDALKALGRDPLALTEGDIEAGPPEGIMTKEGKASGAVSWAVYWYYLSSAGGAAYAPGLGLVMLWNAASWYMQNFSLGVWLGALERAGPGGGADADTDLKLAVFVLCCLSVVIAVIAKNVYVALGSLKASQKLHDKLVRSVLAATVSWFDGTPVGRITNRFSTDIDEVDKEMMFTLQYFMDCVLGTGQVLVAIAVTVPLLLLMLAPVVAFIWWSGYLYVQGSREMKRLESVHKSPVFVLFSETLSGLSTIRAFGQEDRFFDTCTRHTDDMNRCHLYLWMCNRWLACRMQLCGAVVGGVVGLAVVRGAASIGGAAAGLVLVFALNLTDNLTFMSRLYADCQMNLNSVERLQEYSAVPAERYSPPDAAGPSEGAEGESPFAPPPATLARLPEGWPRAGEVEFRDVQLRYESAPEPVLRRVSFLVPARKKVGIVGRTGAGKSSLLAALFRVVEPCGGSILIDGVDALRLPLHTLRSRLAIVPQDPILFKGSIRSNLDPFSEKSDESLWAALGRVRMADHVAAMAGGSGRPSGPLHDKLVADNGANLSVGQRQLLCMARAVLRGATVLVMDEATANVDSATDLVIQETIRSEFGGCTVLCIAHRLHTVANCDLVLVMDKGVAAEFAPPAELLQDSHSIFYGMCQKSGNFEALRSAAIGAGRNEDVSSAVDN